MLLRCLVGLQNAFKAFGPTRIEWPQEGKHKIRNPMKGTSTWLHRLVVGVSLWLVSGRSVITNVCVGYRATCTCYDVMLTTNVSVLVSWLRVRAVRDGQVCEDSAAGVHSRLQQWRRVLLQDLQSQNAQQRGSLLCTRIIVLRKTLQSNALVHVLLKDNCLCRCGTDRSAFWSWCAWTKGVDGSLCRCVYRCRWSRGCWATVTTSSSPVSVSTPPRRCLWAHCTAWWTQRAWLRLWTTCLGTLCTPGSILISTSTPSVSRLISSIIGLGELQET